MFVQRKWQQQKVKRNQSFSSPCFQSTSHVHVLHKEEAFRFPTKCQPWWSERRDHSHQSLDGSYWDVERNCHESVKPTVYTSEQFSSHHFCFLAASLFTSRTYERYSTVQLGYNSRQSQKKVIRKRGNETNVAYYGRCGISDDRRFGRLFCVTDQRAISYVLVFLSAQVGVAVVCPDVVWHEKKCYQQQFPCISLSAPPRVSVLVSHLLHFETHDSCFSVISIQCSPTENFADHFEKV